MKFDINEVLFQMSHAVKENVAENWEEVKNHLNVFLQNKKERLALLADLRLKNHITQKRFESRLLDEQKHAEAELHAIAVISKAIAQRAANAAIKVFQDAVMALVRLP